MVVGVDEVGRGAWAGPLVVGAVILGGLDIEGLTDSKKLTPKRRQVLAREIKDKALSIGLGWVSAKVIDEIGLSRSLKLAAERAIEEINITYDQIILDGTFNFLDNPKVVTMKQADLLIPSVSAASIIAKVARDYYMTTKAHELFPDYGFDRHVGYGTAMHKEALIKHGVSSLHRTSFKPIRQLLGEADFIENNKVKARTIGSVAEDAASQYLLDHGYKILDRNWKTKYCEIDIIAQKMDTIYFVEVKHRASDTQGGGVAAITKKKLSQMKFAANFWRHNNNHSGDARLSVAVTTGQPPIVTQFLPNVS
jgi:ribonuclease HII